MSDRSAVVWTRLTGTPTKIGTILHIGSEVRLTYDAGAPTGVSAVHDVRRLQGIAIPFPVDANLPLPPYLATLLPPRGGPLWQFFLSRLEKKGIRPAAGDEDWPMLLEAGRNGIGHLDVFAHDGIAEAWYAEERAPKVIGEDADRAGLWETFRNLAEHTITDAKSDLLESQIGPTPGVTGMIPKLLVRADRGWLGSSSRLDSLDVMVKTEPERYAGLLALEAECYRIHRDAGSAVPDWWLKSSKSGSPLLATARFDRNGGRPLPLESFYSLARMSTAGAVRERWSNPDPNLQRLRGEVIPDFNTVARLLDLEGLTGLKKSGPEIFRRIALALMTGNSDLHLENLSILGGFGDCSLSPVYDPAPMRCHPEHSMTLALNFGGLPLSKRGRHGEMWERFIEFGKQIGLPRRNRAVDILLECRDATAGWLDFLRGRNDNPRARQLADTLEPERDLLAAVLPAPTSSLGM